MSIIGKPPLYGIYSLGSYARNYPMILDFTYPISLRDATSEDGYTTDNIEIGSILVCEREILVSWYDHDTNTKGVDIIDYNNRIEEAYFISQLLTVDRERLSTFVDFLIAYARLPDETSVELEYSTDYGVTWVPTSAQEIDEGRQLLISRESVESSTLMVKIIVKSYEDTAPSVESIGIVAY